MHRSASTQQLAGPEESWHPRHSRTRSSGSGTPGGRGSGPSSRARSPSPCSLSRSPLLSSSGGLPSPGTQSPFERKSVVASALPLVDPCAFALDSAPSLVHAFKNEIALESALHVNGFTALTCEAAFGFPAVPAQAPDVRADSWATGGGGASHAPSASRASPEAAGDAAAATGDAAAATGDTGLGAAPLLQQVPSFGACLATPIEAPNLGSRPVASAVALRAHTGSSSAYQMQEEVMKCVDRWSDWVRRIRRKRRLEQVQALLCIANIPVTATKKSSSCGGVLAGCAEL